MVWSLLTAAAVVGCASGSYHSQPGISSQDVVAKAIHSRDHDSLAKLLGRGVSPRSLIGRRTALGTATLIRDLDAEALLLKFGAKVDDSDEYGVRPVEIAVMNDDAPSAALMLNAGSNPNRKSRYGIVPLQLAHSKQMAQLLVRFGADVRSCTNDGQTSLMTWTNLGDLELVRYAVLLGSSANATDIHGDTALLYAIREARRYRDLSEACLSWAQPGHVPFDVSTLRAQAENARRTESRYEQIALFLLQKGARPDVPNFEGSTPRRYATQARLFTILRAMGPRIASHPSPR